MAIQYHLNATEILQKLGYTEPIDITELEEFEKENNCKLPPALFEFLSLRNNNPLMETSDIWCVPHFSYQEIEEMIEEDKEYWEKNPDKGEGNESYEFSQIPKEQWPKHVANYLQIGSDYAAGVVSYGININDLGQDNPPVYFLHENNSIRDWRLFSETLSEFLLCIIGDVLSCQDYDTADMILEEDGWDYQVVEYSTPKEAEQDLLKDGIDYSQMTQAKGNGQDRVYVIDAFYSSCWQEKTKTLILIKTDCETCEVYKIGKGE